MQVARWVKVPRLEQVKEKLASLFRDMLWSVIGKKYANNRFQTNDCCVTVCFRPQHPTYQSRAPSHSIE